MQSDCSIKQLLTKQVVGMDHKSSPKSLIRCKTMRVPECPRATMEAVRGKDLNGQAKVSRTKAKEWPRITACPLVAVLLPILVMYSLSIREASLCLRAWVKQVPLTSTKCLRRGSL